MSREGCAFCGDGEVVAVHRGKWCCLKCAETMAEGGVVVRRTRATCGRCGAIIGPPRPGSFRCRCHLARSVGGWAPRTPEPPLVTGPRTNRIVPKVFAPKVPAREGPVYAGNYEARFLRRDEWGVGRWECFHTKTPGIRFFLSGERGDVERALRARACGS